MRQMLNAQQLYHVGNVKYGNLVAMLQNSLYDATTVRMGGQDEHLEYLCQEQVCEEE